MHTPPHPGIHLKEDYLAALGITVTAAAKALGVSRKTLSEIINERAGISVDMAMRLGKAFGDEPELWLRLQQQYDLWYAGKNRSTYAKVKRLYYAEVRI